MTGLVDFLQAGCTAWSTAHSTHRSRQAGSGTAGQAQPKVGKEGQLFLFGRRGGKGEGGNKSPDKTPISHPHTLLLNGPCTSAATLVEYSFFSREFPLSWTAAARSASQNPSSF